MVQRFHGRAQMKKNKKKTKTSLRNNPRIRSQSAPPVSETSRACSAKRRQFCGNNVCEIHEDIAMIGFFSRGRDSKLNHYMKEKSLQGMFALIKQRMNCKPRVTFNLEELVT